MDFCISLPTYIGLITYIAELVVRKPQNAEKLLEKIGGKAYSTPQTPLLVGKGLAASCARTSSPL